MEITYRAASGEKRQAYVLLRFRHNNQDWVVVENAESRNHRYSPIVIREYQIVEW